VLDFFADRLTLFISNYTQLTPNAITIISISVGVAAAFLFLFPMQPLIILAALVFELRLLLDIVDGRLARLTKRYSRLGAALDHGGDLVVIFLCLATLVWGEYRATDSGWTLAFGALYAAAYAFFWALHLVPATVKALSTARSIQQSKPASQRLTSTALTFLTSLSESAAFSRPNIAGLVEGKFRGLRLTLRKLRKWPCSIEAETITFFIFPMLGMITPGILIGGLVMTFFVSLKYIEFYKTHGYTTVNLHTAQSK
jgi:phosphatidylglycerophosphate synthase